ncbi:MAG: LysR family transcriptional regulator [Rhodovulum sulfidophilum]|uniref:LysR family transcriptional regulator n=1 Tax=Rhodovulum sulfidophilum TaxID=35806 RepID=A0A2W5NBJ8_RHOSU|nr:MAG: LysR family transcriptional regulator [Rhodovulum sulfidophilum]
MDQFSLLRLFAGIADKGSLSGAARAQGISPSTASDGLRRLEEQVGARLFLRTTRHLSPTPEGERFLSDCRRILSDLDEAMASVADTGPLRGEIRVSALNDFGRTGLEPLLSAFMALNPGVGVSLTLTDGVSDLAEEGYDLGLRTGPLSDSGLIAHLLLRGRRLVCAAPAYWARHGKPDHPRGLSGHNCLILARPGAPQTSWLFREGARSFTVRIRGDRGASDGGILRKWAVEGAGVILKSDFDVAGDLAAGRLEPALEPFTRDDTNLYAVHPGGRNPSRRVTALVRFLREHLARTGAEAGK